VPAAAEVVAVNAGDRVDLGLAIAALHERGHAVIVSEAGPTVFGELLAERLVDELFLTVSPLVAGRGADRRLGLAEGTELLPQTTDPAKLLSLRRADAHLFLRYGFPSRVER
jgi:5-amino-6-(5-phosphoribosylamino)uracil reductase